MKKHPSLQLLIFGLLFVLSLQCKKAEDWIEAHTPKISHPPKADAGQGRFILLPLDSTELIGKGSDVDGIIVKYEWVKVHGSNSTIVSPLRWETMVRGLKLGTYLFELRVTDNEGLTGADQVEITVGDSASQDPCYGCWDY